MPSIICRLAGSNLDKCLEVYLGNCSKDLDLGVQNAAGHAPVAVAMLYGNVSCLEALSRFTGSRVPQVTAKPSASPKRQPADNPES